MVIYGFNEFNKAFVISIVSYSYSTSDSNSGWKSDDVGLYSDWSSLLPDLTIKPIKSHS